MVNINNGEGGLRKVRTDLYDALFQKYNCDIVFNLAADMLVFKDTLKYARSDKIISFGSLYKTPIASLIMLTIRTLSILKGGRCWRGCYMIPRNVWLKQVRPIFRSSDSYVRLAVDNDFDGRKIKPQTLIIRRHYDALKKVIFYHELNRNQPLIKKIKRMMDAVPI